MDLLTLFILFCPFKPCPWEAYVAFVIGLLVGIAGYAIYENVTKKE